MRTALAGGPRRTKDVEEEAKQIHGIAKRTLERARGTLRIPTAQRPTGEPRNKDGPAATDWWIALPEHQGDLADAGPDRQRPQPGAPSRRAGQHRQPPGPVNPGLCTGQADQTGSASGGQKPGSGRQIVIKTTRDGIGRFEGQAGPRPDLTPAPQENHGNRAEALSTSSLPIPRGRRLRCRAEPPRADRPAPGSSAGPGDRPLAGLLAFSERMADHRERVLAASCRP
jgi:hypothetical protein